MFKGKRIIWIIATLVLLIGVGIFIGDQVHESKVKEEKASRKEPTILETATLSGGCFWCMEQPFEELVGVYEVISGFTGGVLENPTYQQVASGKTQHIESVQIYYDPSVISYESILQVFWRQIDPTDDGGQFVDRGHQYTTAIFYHSDEQKALAEESKAFMNASGRYTQAIVTPIRAFTVFYEAEDYHQDYYRLNPLRYKYYRNNSGRDQYLEKVWGEEIKMTLETKMDRFKNFDKNKRLDELDPLQYKVTQKKGTEKPFNNAYWDNKEQGIYVDIVSGEPLFSSIDKYVSGTGWPSFVRPLEPENVLMYEDNTLFTKRTEVKSKYADSHLGHVFNDGPEPTGLRYCLNSAALRFVPLEALEEEGYGEYLKLFKTIESTKTKE